MTDIQHILMTAATMRFPDGTVIPSDSLVQFVGSIKVNTESGMEERYLVKWKGNVFQVPPHLVTSDIF